MKHRLLYLTITVLLLASTAFGSSITYEYDELDRLHKVTENDKVITYEYDEIGNMISRTPSGNVVTISASATSGGSIYPNGSITITAGGSKTYSITPRNTYRVSTSYKGN
jgi:YD repeat-containing protein